MQYQFNTIKAIFDFVKIHLFFCLFVCLLFFLFKNTFPDAEIFSWMFFITLLPTLVIFVEYFVEDFGKKVSFCREENKIVCVKKGLEYVFNFEQLCLVQLNATQARLQKNSFRTFITDEYFFYQFTFSDGKSFILTSLMLNGKLMNEVNFRGIKIEKQRRFFAFL